MWLILDNLPSLNVYVDSVWLKKRFKTYGNKLGRSRAISVNRDKLYLSIEVRFIIFFVIRLNVSICPVRVIYLKQKHTLLKNIPIGFEKLNRV